MGIPWYIGLLDVNSEVENQLEKNIDNQMEAIMIW